MGSRLQRQLAQDFTRSPTEQLAGNAHKLFMLGGRLLVAVYGALLAAAMIVSALAYAFLFYAITGPVVAGALTLALVAVVGVERTREPD